MRLLSAKDRIARPWKNGGGVTRDVAIAPPDANLDTFDWRISFADVASDGPFSTFANVDRTLTVVTGEGIALRFGDDEERALRRGAPFAFTGDAAVASRLLAGPIVDLNVMTRRGAMSHRVRRVEAPERLRTPAPLAFVVCGAGACALSAPTRRLALQLYDVADVSGEAAEITPEPGALVLLVEIVMAQSGAAGGS
ncbi:MAG: HutD family protein [Rhizobiales bacterium]|nr:HutD family protein [Hyphomicrobiales bacterium]